LEPPVENRDTAAPIPPSPLVVEPHYGRPVPTGRSDQVWHVRHLDLQFLAFQPAKFLFPRSPLEGQYWNQSLALGDAPDGVCHEMTGQFGGDFDRPLAPDHGVEKSR
jgi:hypothetical protein